MSYLFNLPRIYGGLANFYWLELRRQAFALDDYIQLRLEAYDQRKAAERCLEVPTHNLLCECVKCQPSFDAYSESLSA